MTRHRFFLLFLFIAATGTILICSGSAVTAQDSVSRADDGGKSQEAENSQGSAGPDTSTADSINGDSADPSDDSTPSERQEPESTGQPLPKLEPLTPEQEKVAESHKAHFDDLHQQLIQAVTQMRATYIRYQNGEDQSPDAQQRYRQHRDQFRKLMRQTYDAADQLLLLKFDQDAVTFIGTTLKHRENHDIYDESTMRGSLQLIDGNARELFLFLGAARSAVCVGDFDIAKRVYESIGEEQMEDVDKSLLFQIDEIAKQWEEEVKSREEDAKKELPRVRLSTTRGDFVVELFIDSAPSAVAQFIGLVEDGYYDELDFYQVMDHLLALTGDASGNGTGNTGQFLIDEHENENARNGVRGSLIMAKVPIGETGTFVPNSASSQFAILFLPVTTVREHQTVFGRVIEGMDVVSSLRRVDPTEKDKKDKIIVPPDRILTAEVIRRPKELPEPEYLDLEQAVSTARRQLQQSQSPSASP